MITISQDTHLLPLTNNVYLLQGYFRALFTCIEQLLVSMNVEKIVLPAAEDAESIWTKKLGFKKISDEQVSVWARS